MERCVSVLAVLAVASAATVPSLPQVSWTVDDAVDLFNKGSNEDYIFKLVETDAEYVVIPQDQSTRPHQMHFTIMETRCLVSENKNTQDCDFKKDGAMKACTAVLLVEPDRNLIKINCDSLTLKRTRARRPAWRRCHRTGCYSIIGSITPVGDSVKLEILPELISS